MKIKSLVLTIAALLICTTTHAQSPKDYMPYSYGFVGLQGGLLHTFATGDRNHGKLTTPIGAFQIGAQFTPVIGARLHVMGIKGRVPLKRFYSSTAPMFISDSDIPNIAMKDVYSSTATKEYNFVNTDIDVLVNLTNLMLKAHYLKRFLDVYFIAGMGLNYAWDAKPQRVSSDKEKRFTHNLRLGLMFEANIARNWGINLEATMNQPRRGYYHDWQLAAIIGVRYKFNCKYKIPAPSTIPMIDEIIDEQNTEIATAPVVVREEKPAPPVVEEAPKPKPVEQPKPVFIPATSTMDLFFHFNRTDIDEYAAERLQIMGNWLNSHENSRVVVTGYADKGTGSAKRNMALSEQRANNVANQLVNEYGFERSKITVDFKGDTVQPYSENDKNRLVRIEARMYEAE